MKNFHINNPDEPQPTPESHLWTVGTQLKFFKIGSQFKAAIKIPVAFA